MKLFTLIVKLFTLKNLILIACLVSTAYAEHQLAVWVGWNAYIACTLPGVLDIYLIHATKTRKDMVYAVSAVILVNATSYAVTAPFDPLRTTISIGVSVLAPIVLWRLHATEHAERPQEPVSEPADAPVYEFLPAGLIEDLTPVKPAPAPEPEKLDTAPEATKLPRGKAMAAAEEGYAYGREVKDVAAETGYSAQSVYRWYKAFEKNGVKKLVNA